jgi:hypothetical protein
MKKIALSLLGAATLAMSSNAMALDTTVIYKVGIQRGSLTIPVGFAQFEFDSDIPFAIVPSTLGTPAFPEGACEYDMEWVNELADPSAPGLPLSAECFLLEAKSHAAASCVNNFMHDVPSILVADTTAGSPAVTPGLPMGSECTGFDYFQNFQTVAQINLGESFALPGKPGVDIEGLIQFASPLTLNSFFGFRLLSL